MQQAVEQLTKMVEDAKSGRGAFGSNTEVKSGKDYDPTAAAREEKERRELRHKTAMEKKQAKEQAECTFRPAVSRKSVELLQQTQKERPSLHSPVKTPSRQAYKGPNVQGKPQISEVSRAMMASKDRTGPIYERLISEGEELRRNKEKAVETAARQEADSVVGVPQIDKASAQIVKKNSDARASMGGSTVERLTRGHTEKRQETLKKLEIERNATFKAQNEFKVYTNAKSHQLAKKLEASGNTSKQRMYSAASQSVPRSPHRSPENSRSPASGSKNGSAANRASRPATAPPNRNGSLNVRTNSMTPRALASTRSPNSTKSSPPFKNAAQSLDGLDDVEALRAEFERLVNQREETAAKAVEEMEAAVARAREKEQASEHNLTKMNAEITSLKARSSELADENEKLRQDKIKVESEVQTLTKRQKESDTNEEHLNEKLKAITEKCQAVLVHNSKLQEQVNKSRALSEASDSETAGAQT